jgi:hypothetical protein
MDLREFIEQFQDHLAPKLDTYEQAVYLYIFRHSVLAGLEEATIGFKSARKRMALGIGKKGSPPSENIIYRKLRSLSEKGCLRLVGMERGGSRIMLFLPSEIPGVIPRSEGAFSTPLEEMDFFNVDENRMAIAERESWKCFYCLRKLSAKNYVIEHVLSRPEGDDSYRNVVAACFNCNNKKGTNSAQNFLRLLYREGYLEQGELEARLLLIERLRCGDLKPVFKKRSVA